MGLLKSSGTIETIGAEKAKDWIAGQKDDEITVLDVRQPQEYSIAHIPGAVFIPLPELIDRIVELDRSKSVIAYCRSGNRSRSAAALLVSDGFRSVFNLDGGIKAWNGFVAQGDYGKGMHLLKGGETSEELIMLAWSLEDGSRLFYEKASAMISDNESKELLRLLMSAEARHKEHIMTAYKIVAGAEIEEEVLEKAAHKGIMESGEQVEDVIDALRKNNAALEDILEVSMQVEVNALDLYIKMLREIKNERVVSVFASLIDEEKRHLSRLGKLLGEKFHPNS
ncbi:MAG: hypothetical protein HQL10_07775 [Nitrospirae bacterium]|nr:hypothetical protein [Nitrospirota bacterium]